MIFICLEKFKVQSIDCDFRKFFIIYEWAKSP